MAKQTNTKQSSLLDGDMPPAVSTSVIIGCVIIFFALPLTFFCNIPLIHAVVLALVLFAIPVAALVIHAAWKHLAAGDRVPDKKFVPANCAPGTVFVACLSPQEELAYKVVALYFLPLAILSAWFWWHDLLFHYHLYGLIALLAFAIWAFALGLRLAWRVDVRVDGLLVYTSLAKRFYSWADVMLLQAEKIRAPGPGYQLLPEPPTILYSIYIVRGKVFFFSAFETRYKLASFIAKHTFNAAKRGLDPPAARTMISEAAALYAEGDYIRASELYTEALSKDEFSENALYGRGLANLQLGQQTEAIQDLSQFIALNDGTPDAYLARGLLYEQLQKFREATDDYGKASALLDMDSPWLSERLQCCEEKLNRS